MADFFATTGFWVLVPTLIFALALWKPAKKATLGRLDAYADKVRGELEETHRLRDEAQALHARFQRDLREARQHTDSIRENADKQAVRFKTQALNELETTLEMREEHALAIIEQAEQAALNEARDIAASVAVKAAALMLAEDIGPKQDAALIDAALADLPDRLAQ